MASVTEAASVNQAERVTVAKLTREELHQLVRAAMAGLEAGAMARWTAEDADTFTHALMPCLTALRESYKDDAAIGLRVGNAVLAAVHGRNTGFAGYTWGSLRAAIDALVSPGEEVASIEFGAGLSESRHLHVERDEHGSVEIRGMRRPS